MRDRKSHGCVPISGRHGFVVFYNCREAQRVGETVMHSFFARERMRERVTRAESFLKRDGAHHRGFHHPAARFEIFSVFHRGRQMLRAELEPAERDRVAIG